MKLTIELVPSTSWCTNVRSIVSTKDWDILRKMTYKNNKHKCEICNKTGILQGFPHPVECHEIWEYDDVKHTQTLVGLISLCPICHKAKHLGRTMVMDDPFMRDVHAKLREVNNMTNLELHSYIVNVFDQHANRSKHLWNVNINLINHLLGRPFQLKVADNATDKHIQKLSETSWEK